MAQATTRERYTMRQRIKAAWMVLRGEWIAQKPGPEVWAGFQQPYANTTTSSAGTTVTWKPTR
jgi:hypothetical protein